MGLLEGLLAFRLIFKLLGANPASGFVTFIYSVTEPFVAPFYGIFGQVTTTGAETVAVFEPATLIAMLIYALVAWLVVRLIGAASGRPVDREI
ncbi:MAG TPA: YggT family protein [Candidatus Saccharimonadia bacterium]